MIIWYVHALEEDKSSLKHTVSQLHLHQEDLENRERCLNLHIRGVLEKVSDKNVYSYLLGLFNTLAPDIADRLAPGQSPQVPGS